MAIIAGQVVSIESKISIDTLPGVFDSLISGQPVISLGGLNSNIYFNRLSARVDEASSYQFNLMQTGHKLIAVQVRSSRPIQVSTTQGGVNYKLPLTTYWLSINNSQEEANYTNLETITVSVPSEPAQVPADSLSGVYPSANVEVLVIAQIQ
jgi:hypothetical protein